MMNRPPDEALRRPVLGCIADDVTGATDLAINLAQGGMCVVQVLGVPSTDELAEVHADAVVVALKSRSICRDDAISQSLESLTALQSRGMERFFFKYCSTFDSTPEGNIGPVAEALMAALGVEQTLFCPALPRNGRTVYQGHLFVNGRLLNESGMQHHPLNPMTDANLLRLLGEQCTGKVGLLSYETLADGPADVARGLHGLAEAGNSLIIADTCDDRHLQTLAHAVADMRLVTGGSGIAKFLPAAYRQIGIWDAARYEPSLPRIEGRSLILSGSCSAATNGQVSWMKSKCPSWQVDVAATVTDPASSLAKILDWARATASQEPLLVYSTCPPEQVAVLQREFGGGVVAEAVEQLLASIAGTLVAECGVRRLVLAGGETAGAVVRKLQVRSLAIGPEICAGVPWTVSLGPTPLALALKSGNFGSEDFFQVALEMLP